MTAGVLDADTWQVQLDEFVALSSILDEDFRLLSTGGVAVAGEGGCSTAADGDSQAREGGEGHADDELGICPQDLYMHGPPTQPGVFSCEVNVHVDTLLPDGLQLLISTASPEDGSRPQGQAAHALAAPATSSRGNSNGRHNRLSTAASATVAAAAAAMAAVVPASHQQPAAASTPQQQPDFIPFGQSVKHLPPVCMQLTFPPSYPSGTPPNVQLRAMWLRHTQAQQLQAALLKQWEVEGGPGTPICYTWVEWLKGNALQELGILSSGAIQLGPLPRSSSRKAQATRSVVGTGPQQPSQSLPAAAAAAAAAAAGGGAGGLADGHSFAGFSNGTGATSSKQAAQHRGRGGGQGQQHQHLQPPTSPVTPSQQVVQQQQHLAQDDADYDQDADDWQQHVPGEQLALSLVRYSVQHEAYLFRSQPVTCPVCFEDILGAKCMRLECGHHTCLDCFTTYVRTQVKEGQVECIRCMEPSCKAPVQASIIQSVLSQEEYERWEALLLQRTLDKMEDVVYCPRCHSTSLEDKDHCAQCPKCFYVFCGLCDEAWHPGSSCLSPDQVVERKRERLERSGNMSAEERQRRQQDLIGEYKSVALVYSTSKQCPACSMAIQKTEGCNKMTCGFCSTKFCFRCLRVIDNYDHFGVGKCDLFDMEEINRWNAAQMDLGERYYHVAAAGFMVREARRRPARAGVRVSSCPTCGQYNMKDSRNNLLRCYACNTHFCYTCREVLRYKPGQHFGPGARQCKQHTDN